LKILRAASGLAIELRKRDAQTVEDVRLGRLDFALGVGDEVPHATVGLNLSAGMRWAFRPDGMWPH
jgi:hypothetical protein